MAIPTTGLVTAYDPLDIASYDPASPTVLLDTVGTVDNTIYGTFTYDATYGSLNSNSSSDAIYSPQNNYPPIVLSSGWSCSTWVNATVKSGSDYTPLIIFGSAGGSGQGTGFYLAFEAGNNIHWSTVDINGGNVPFTWNANQWYNITVTYASSGTLKFYVDNVLVYTTSSAIRNFTQQIPPLAQNVFAGFFNGSTPAGWSFNVNKGPMQYWDKELTVVEVEDIYDTYKLRFNPPVVELDFSDPACFNGTGLTVNDLSASNNDFTLADSNYIFTSTYGGELFIDTINLDTLLNRSGLTGYSYGSAAFSFHMWVQINAYNALDLTAIWALNFTGGAGNPHNNPFCGAIGASKYFFFTDGTDTLTTTFVMAPNTWYLVTITYPSGGTTNDIELYIDGVSIPYTGGTAGVINAASANPLNSLSASLANSAVWNSAQTIGSYYFYNVALTANEVLDFYNDTRLRFIPPVVHLDSTNAASNTGSGNIWYDLSANNLDFTGTGTSRVTFNYNEVFDLGTGKYFTGANNLSSVIDWDDDWTIELWINNSGSQIGTYNSPWGTGYSYPTNTGVRVDTHTSLGSRAYFGYSSGSYEITTYPAATISIPSDATTIHQFVVRKTGDTIQFLLDGVASYSLSGITNAVSLTADPFFIGYGGFYDPLVGNVAVLRGYDYALTNAQVLDNYNTTDAILNPAAPPSAVHEYDAEDPSSYPGSGSTLFDIGTATAIDLTINDATFNSTNDSFTLDGTLSSYIRSANSLPDFDIGANDFTIQYWFKYNAPTAQPPYNIFLLIGSRSGSYSGFTNFTYSGQFNIGKPGVADYATGFYPNIGQWYQVTMTVDSSNLVTLYIDGVSTYSQTISFVTAANTLAMGDNGIQTDGVANASMGPLLIYDRVLTGTEITDYYDTTEARFNAIPTAIGEYDFSNIASYPGTGGTVHDLSGTGNSIYNATLSGTFGGTGQSKYYSFTGGSDQFVKDAAVGFAGTQLFTASSFIWVKSSDWNSPAQSAGYNYMTGYGLDTYPGGGHIGFAKQLSTTYYPSGAFGLMGSGFGATNFPGGLTNNDWQHLGYVADGTNCTLYLNGVQVGTTPQTYNWVYGNVGPLSWVGRDPVYAYTPWITLGGLYTNYASGSNFDIAIAEFYATNLSPANVLALYNSQEARFAYIPPPYVGSVGGRQFGGRFAG